MRARGEKAHCGETFFVCWPDADFGNPLAEGRCRSGDVIGPMTSSLPGPCRILQWAAKFIRESADSGRGGKVYALSELVEHMSLSRELFEPLVGYVDCESPIAHLWSKHAIAGKYRVRHFWEPSCRWEMMT